MKKRVQRGLQLFAGMVVVLFLSACGGTSSNSHQNFVQQPAPVQQLAISTTSLPNGTQGQAYSVTLQASGGTGSDTWRVVNGLLPDDLSLNPANGVISGIPATAQTATFTVQARDSSASPQTSTQQLTLTIGAAPLSIATSLLPAASVNQAYQVTLATGGGVNPFAWTLASGILPPGLLLLNDGRIIGIATATGTFNFTVRVQDGTPSIVTRSLALQIVPSGVRNDTVANATAISNGVVRASISPYGDSSMAPDTDYYRLTAAPGAVVKVELLPAGPIDPLVEIVDANGARLPLCSAASAGPFSTGCISDYEDTDVLPSARLFFQAPAGSTPATLFLHVLDWRGDARPDMLYDLKVSRAN